MCDEWMRPLQLEISFAEFHALPRNNAYKYEYLDGHAYLSPRPKYYHALLDLDAYAAAAPKGQTAFSEPLPAGANPDVRVRPLLVSDWETMVPLLAAAFERQLPFGALEAETRQQAVRHALERTRAGGDGPVIESASLMALDGPGGSEIGAILVTLLPDADPSAWDSFHWREPPPADCIEHRLGRPHLTWIFVHPWCAGRGTGTALLTGAVGRLRALGYREMASTFLPTNDSSVLWHWRCGFRLVEYAGSTRRVERRIRESLRSGPEA
jgi:ribosomal protein S18 acetylase RimI-like enzyme